jgi:hypothetical protein
MHFSLAEFVYSATAARRGIVNTLPLDLVAEAERTLAMLEGIRAFLAAHAGRDVPMVLSSGYRCPALNWAVRRPTDGPGSDPSGDHPRAKAADWTAPAFGPPLQICQLLAPHVSTLGIGQLIFEGTWVHTSTQVPLRSVNRIVTKVAGGYVPGIVA